MVSPITHNCSLYMEEKDDSGLSFLACGVGGTVQRGAQASLPPHLFYTYSFDPWQEAI